MILSIILILVGPAVFLYGYRTERGYYYKDSKSGEMVWQKGLGTIGIIIELVGAISIWVGIPMGIYGLVAKDDKSKKIEPNYSRF